MRMCMCVYVLSRFSDVRFFETLWTVGHQVYLSTRFSRQERWSGSPCSLPGDLTDSGIKPASLTFPVLAGGFFTTSASWEATMRISSIN